MSKVKNPVPQKKHLLNMESFWAVCSVVSVPPKWHEKVSQLHNVLLKTILEALVQTILTNFVIGESYILTCADSFPAISMFAVSATCHSESGDAAG